MARIEDYALIGDCETAALVSRDGSIDWLCVPRFDSDACFAALLGDENNGRWKLAPKTFDTVTRAYRPGTLILETTFVCASGKVKVIDFMPPKDGHFHLLRQVVGLEGTVAMAFDLAIRFDYGITLPWVTRIDPQTLRAVAGANMLVLRTSVALKGVDMKTVGEFEVAAGKSFNFELGYAPSHRDMPPALDADRALSTTEGFWTDWSSRCKEAGPYSDTVCRSLITLKALTFDPTGGMVAAPTTSLPEQIGGARNWDYRFCWIRDATLTLLALMGAGYYEEARAWRDWLVRAVAGSPAQLQIMYGVAGERRLSEWDVPWLDGYENSRPVRIGNAAHEQLQLDVFGELMDALYQARKGGLKESQPVWAVERALLLHLAEIWIDPDEGIWEVRGERQHFTHSKIMAWVAFDRAIKSAEEFGLDGPVQEWKRLRSQIHEDVCTRGYDTRRETFVQVYGQPQLDASLLLIASVGFLTPDDPRFAGTVRAIEHELISDGFVRRYDTAATDDGLPPGEGMFLACSFWLADAYQQLGRQDDARALFERLLDLCNDVGLLSEEYDPKARRLVGNFPQAFSHISLINTARNLTDIDKPMERRSGSRTASPSDAREPANAAGA